MTNIYDVVVIGAGAGGLTTALYTARGGLKTLVIEKGVFGGQMQDTAEIENYSGFDSLTGAELSERMYEQATNQGAEYMYGDVKRVEKVDGIFKLHLKSKEIQSKSVVIATGVQHRHLGVEGEEKFAGRGVSYCALCDGAFFKDKHVVVVGGGDSALEEANYLTQFVGSVTIIHRSDKFKGQAVLQKRVEENPIIVTLFNTVATRISGDKGVEKVGIATNCEDGTIVLNRLECDGVFIYIGLDPITTIFEEHGVLDSSGYVVTDNNMKTSVEGLFAVGDVRQKEVRQIATAVGDGAIAGVSVNRYLESLN